MKNIKAVTEQINKDILILEAFKFDLEKNLKQKKIMYNIKIIKFDIDENEIINEKNFDKFYDEHSPYLDVYYFNSGQECHQKIFAEKIRQTKNKK